MFDMFINQLYVEIGGIVLFLILIGGGIGYYIGTRTNIKKDS